MDVVKIHSEQQHKRSIKHGNMPIVTAVSASGSSARWIQRINAAARLHGLTYSQMMGGLIKAGIEIDRKMLADLAVHEPQAFAALVERSRAAS